MTELKWLEATHPNPRIYYLYQGKKCLGAVFKVNAKKYSVFKDDPSPFSEFRRHLCDMPTLTAAKQVLQTIVGSQS